MGGVQDQAVSSLDRLKALDSLPNVEYQLAEARQLCTHGARADMITRWLLERMKSSQDIRCHPVSWDVLLMAIRLLPVPRVVSLLGAGHFFETAETTLAGLRAANDTTAAVANSLQFLIELPASAHCNPIKAMLSLKATRAATLFGLLLECASKSLHSTMSRHSNTFLSVSFQLWDMRKPSSDENILFSKYCLRMITNLLSLLKVDFPGAVSLKRKRTVYGKDQLEPFDYIKSIEALLAKHIFIPARTTLFKYGSLQESSSRSNGSVDSIDSGIENLLKPEILFPRLFNGAGPQYCWEPLLLDVALRSTAAPSAKQLSKNAPWVEAVFKALHSCNQNKDGSIINVNALTQMLKVVRKHATLSQQTLELIVHSCSKLKNPTVSTDVLLEHRVEWELLVEVVSLDAGLFCKPYLLEMLLRNLRDARQRDQSTMHNQVQLLQAEPPEFVTANIMVPVVKEFSKRRQLPVLIQHWYEQLQETQNWDIVPMLRNLDTCIGAEMEDSMTETQIEDLFNERQRALDNGKTELEPSILVLYSLLAGVRSESLRAKLRDRCEQLFAKLLQIIRDSGNKRDPDTKQNIRLFALSTQAFRLWFPLWLVDHPELASLEEKVEDWQLEVTLGAVLAIYLHGTDLPQQQARNAECFVSCVCSILLEYAQAVGESPRFEFLHEVVDKLLRHIDSETPDAIVLFPSLINFTSTPEIRRSIIAGWMDVLNIEASTKTEGVISCILSVAEYALSNSKMDIIEDIVSSSLTKLRSLYLPDENESAASEPVSVLELQNHEVLQNIIARIPVNALSRGQRERVLDTVFQSIQYGSCHIGRGHVGLQLMIRLMEKPNATAEICTDPSALWCIALNDNVDDFIPKPLEGWMLLHYDDRIPLFNELISLTLGHLGATQDQERSRIYLYQVATDTKAMLDFLSMSQNSLDTVCHGTAPQYLAIPLATCNAMVQGLEACQRSEPTFSTLYKDAATLDRLFHKLSNFIIITITARCKSLDPESRSDTRLINHHNDKLLGVAFQTLRTIAKVRPTSGNLDTRSLTAKLMDFLQQTISRKDSRRDTKMFLKYLEMFECFTFVCQNAGSADNELVFHIARYLLSQEENPVKIDQMVRSLSAYLNADDAKLARAAAFLFLKDEISSPTDFLLFNECLKQLTKDDFTGYSQDTTFAYIPFLLRTASRSSSPAIRVGAIDCILLILKTKPFLVNQYTIEATLAQLPKLLDVETGLSMTYLRVCQILTRLLLNYRARLHGRFHIVIMVFQDMLSRLFEYARTKGTNVPTSERLNSSHAHALSRVLVLFCEPLQLRNQSKSDLVDEARKEQAHVGQFVQYILHHYCMEVLKGSLERSVQDALTPGLWAMIDAVGINSSDGIKSLSAAMNNNERAILRTVYDEWKRFGKWQRG